ncbi:MAG: phytanoyl-CoA dioxygenase family protein [Planctomycetota bacterium]|nr:phytanoyl-CoA dioxygenase family protein [Planctomycetota bacterium]
MEEIRFSRPAAVHQEKLDERGFVVLPSCINQRLLAQLIQKVECLWTREGKLAGAEFKQEENARRLANLVDKSRLFEQVVLQADALALVHHVLGEFKLSSLNARSANPLSASGQPLHCDGGLLPDQQGALAVNVVWCLDDFKIDNGTLRVVPGTHLAGKLPQEALDNPEARHPDEELICTKAGSLIVMNAHLWHSGMNNGSSHPRRALHAYYCRRDQPQQQFQQTMLSDASQQVASGLLRHILALDDAPLEAEKQGVNSVSGFLV